MEFRVLCKCIQKKSAMMSLKSKFATVYFIEARRGRIESKKMGTVLVVNKYQTSKSSYLVHSDDVSVYGSE